MTQITISKLRLYSLYAGFTLVGAIIGGILTSIITPAVADDILATYLKNDALMTATESTFGGTFPRNLVFTPREKKVGVRFWFCYNASDPRYPKMFLAGERLSSYKFPETTDEPAQDTLFAIDASSSFRYSGNTLPKDLKAGEIYDYLNKRQEVSGTVVDISKAEVIAFSDEFKKRVQPMTGYLDYKACFFFFDNTNDFGNFLGQQDHTGAKDVKYVRYFFAFDDKEATNKIRVLLIAVNSKGENIAAQNSIILQKSVPPPPDL